MPHGANVLCIEIALILYISYAGDTLESLSRNSARFKPNVKKKEKVVTLKTRTDEKRVYYAVSTVCEAVVTRGKKF